MRSCAIGVEASGQDHKKISSPCVRPIVGSVAANPASNDGCQCQAIKLTASN
jgi:hypothetical protein